MALRVNTLFFWCADVEPVRHFYSDLLGLPETLYRNDDQAGWLTYLVDGVQLVFMRGAHPPAVETEFASQPGFEGGTKEVFSWLFSTPSQAEFDAIVERLKAAGVPRLHDEALVNTGASQFIVRDPTGMTVEVTVEA